MTQLTVGEKPALPVVTRREGAGRADALDALRELAILAMALSGLLPFGKATDGTYLPGWMYHAQVPPPLHQFNPDLPGLTWVDLVFPFFLFSLGAAIPLALARRIEAGEPSWRLAWHAVKRYGLLIAFAIYVQHIAPGVLARTPDAKTWLTALLGFGLLFPALARLPRAWPMSAQVVVRAVGWGGATALLLTHPFRDGQGFDPLRNDIIIVVLANVALSGTLLWLASRGNGALRLAFMLGLLALRLSHESADWLRTAWSWEGVPGPVGPYLNAYLRVYYQQYLLIVLPGTMAGDLLLEWLSRRGADERPTWLPERYAGIAALLLGLNVLLLCGLQARWQPGTTVAAAGACAAGALLFHAPGSTFERLVRRLFGWGVLWLLVGLLFEPYEGGIKKDHATVSYYFVTSGLASFALVLFSVLLDVFRLRRVLGLLIHSGQNPMIAYAGVRSLLAPLVGLTGIEAAVPKLFAAPWPRALYGGLKTLLLAGIVSGFTRARVYWRT